MRNIESFHQTHKTFPVQEDSTELFAQLESIVLTCRRKGQEIAKRIKGLNKCEEEIDVATKLATKKMKKQCDDLVQALYNIYEEAVENMKNLQTEQVLKLKEQKEKLTICDKQREGLEATSKRFIAEIGSSDFSTRASTFLTYLSLPILPKDEEHSLIKPVFKQPSYKNIVSEIPAYIRLNFLGDVVMTQLKQNRGSKLFHNSAENPLVGSLQSSGVGESIRSDKSEDSHSDSNSTITASPLDSHESRKDPISSTNPSIIINLVSFKDLKLFEGLHLKNFSSVFYKEDTVWISGWIKNRLWRNDTVLLNVLLPDFTTVQTQKKTDPQSGQDNNYGPIW